MPILAIFHQIRFTKHKGNKKNKNAGNDSSIYRISLAVTADVLKTRVLRGNNKTMAVCHNWQLVAFIALRARTFSVAKLNKNINKIKYKYCRV
jgi:hypothetical protein